MGYKKPSCLGQVLMVIAYAMRRRWEWIFQQKEDDDYGRS